MKLIRHILFSFVLLIILGHASFAHSHESRNDMCRVHSSVEYSFLDLLQVIVSSDTGKHHLEDYKEGKGSLLLTQLLSLDDSINFNSIVINHPLNEPESPWPNQAIGFTVFHPFYTIYTLRGSPFLS